MLLSHCQNIGIFLEAFLDLIVMVLNLIKTLKTPGFAWVRQDLLGFAFYWHILSFLGWVCLGVLGCAGVCWGVLGCAIKSPPFLGYSQEYSKVIMNHSTVQFWTNPYKIE